MSVANCEAEDMRSSYPQLDITMVTVRAQSGDLQGKLVMALTERDPSGVTAPAAFGSSRSVRAPLRGDQRAHLREQINQRARARASYRQIEKREQLLDAAIEGGVIEAKINRAPCPACGRRFSGRGPVWTEARIIAAIQKWADDHGQPPTADEWTLAGDDHPGRMTIKNRFGSWNKAIAAAGFQPRRQGDYRVGAASAGRATGGALRTPGARRPSSAPPTTKAAA